MTISFDWSLFLRIKEYGFPLKQIRAYLQKGESSNEYAKSEIAKKIQEIDNQLGVMQKQRIH